MSENFLSDLSNDIAQLLSCGYNYDVIIQAGEDQNVKELFAHSIILGARSTYFKTAFSKEWVKKENGIILFKKPNISPEIFELILTFLYTGTVKLDHLDGTQVLKLFAATDELNLQKLCDYVLLYLNDNQVEHLRDEPVEILQTVFQYEVYENLRNNCLETVCENPTFLFESSKFALLDKDLLILLLKQDNIKMEEFEIWNYILKWGISKISTQLDIDNVSNWTSDDFGELEEMLHDLIPHIRWFQIPLKTVWDKVNSFKPLLPRKLYKNIIGYHINQDKPPDFLILPQRNNLSFNSNLINENKLLIIASWIDKKKLIYNPGNNPYSFKLLYRASKHGFDENTFHKLCDNRGSTIMISKLQKNGELIGGYNPLSWKTCEKEYMGSTSDSFLFSFAKHIASIARVTSDVEYQKRAVYYSSMVGPAFGSGFDLVIRGNSMYSYNSNTYPKVRDILDGKQTIADYEVFQVKQEF